MHDAIKIVGQDFIALSVLGLAGVWFGLNRADKKRLIVVFILAGVVAYCLAKIGAALYNDPRPFIVNHTTPYFMSSTDNGFPSDHTLLASLVGFLALRYNRRAGVGLLVLAILIAAARVTAGVHHVSDVVGSFVLSGIAVVVAQLLLKRFAEAPKKQ